MNTKKNRKQKNSTSQEQHNKVWEAEPNSVVQEQTEGPCVKRNDLVFADGIGVAK